MGFEGKVQSQLWKEYPGLHRPKNEEEAIFCEALVIEDGIAPDCGQLCGRVSSKKQSQSAGEEKGTEWHQIGHKAPKEMDGNCGNKTLYEYLLRPRAA